MDERQARDDLAFMRSIVAAGDESLQPMGRAYLAAGLCYGGQCLLSGAQSLGWLPDAALLHLIVGIGPTIVFAALMIWLSIRDRNAPKPNRTGHAIGMVFVCVGIANVALIAAIGAVALAQQSLLIWLIYPCVVVILQGMAWLFAYFLKCRLWLALIAGGWIVIGISMAIALGQERIGWYVLILGIGLFAFMAAPGAYLMRSPRGH